MTARVWDVDELNRVHLLPDGWRWMWLTEYGLWCARYEDDSGGWAEVWVEGGALAYSEHLAECPADVALAVILASQGRDSLDALADAMVRHRDAAARAESRCRRTKKHARANQHVGKWEAFDLARAMLRRGRVEP
jgi:hypothetical protein